VIIVIDSDALIGSLCPQDQHFKETLVIREQLAKLNPKIIYPATVIVETATFLQGRLNRPDLAKRATALISEEVIIEPVGSVLLMEALEFMDFKGAKHDTLFDAIVAAAAKKYSADAIFSFDKFYEKKGFKLASDL